MRIRGTKTFWKVRITNPLTGQTEERYLLRFDSGAAVRDALRLREDITPIGELPDKWIVEIERVKEAAYVNMAKDAVDFG